MSVGIARAVGRNANGAVAKDPGGRDAEESAVDPAAVGHEDGAERCQARVQGRGLRSEVSAVMLNGRIQRIQRRRGHSSQFSFSSASSSSSSSSSNSSPSSSSSPFSSSSSSSSSSSERSSSIGDVPVTSRFEPQSGQLIKSPLSTSNSSTSISASHSGQVDIHVPEQTPIEVRIIART